MITFVWLCWLGSVLDDLQFTVLLMWSTFIWYLIPYFIWLNCNYWRLPRKKKMMMILISLGKKLKRKRKLQLTVKLRRKLVLRKKRVWYSLFLNIFNAFYIGRLQIDCIYQKWKYSCTFNCFETFTFWFSSYKYFLNSQIFWNSH